MCWYVRCALDAKAEGSIPSISATGASMSMKWNRELFDDVCYIVYILTKHRSVHIDRFYGSLHGRWLSHNISGLIRMFELHMAERVGENIELTKVKQPIDYGLKLELYMLFIANHRIPREELFTRYADNWQDFYWVLHDVIADGLIEYRDGEFYWTENLN